MDKLMTQLASRMYDGSTKNYLLNDDNLQLMVSKHVYLDKTKGPTAHQAFLLNSKNQVCRKPLLDILLTGKPTVFGQHSQFFMCQTCPR